MFDKLALILNKMRAKGDFLGGPVVKNPASKAGDVASILAGWGTKIPHAVGQLSP